MRHETQQDFRLPILDFRFEGLKAKSIELGAGGKKDALCSVIANQKSQIKNRLSLIVILALFAFVWGCGYRSRSDLLGHIDSVTISPIGNETVEYGLEDDLVNAIKQEFERHWGEGTDSVFTGAIRMYEILPISLDQNNQPEQYRLLLGMSFVFEDLKRNRVLRNEKSYEKTHDFYVVPDRGEPPETLKEARQKLVEEAAEDIVSSIVEEW